MNETNAMGSTPPITSGFKPATTSSIDSKPSEFWTVFSLSLLLGVFGAHRFYARKFKSAIVQLVTFGGLGIWSFIDVLMILLSKFKNANGVVFKNPKPKVAWSIFAVVCVLAAISSANDKQSDGDSSNNGRSSSVSSSSHKSARQLIRDRAEELYGRKVDVTIDSGFAGGAYQVTISDNEHFHNYTVAATVDEGNQEITSWETKQID